MGILTLLRNAFGRSRKGRAAEAEGADSTPSPAPEPQPEPAAQIPEPRQSSPEEQATEHDLVSAAFNNVTVPRPSASAEAEITLKPTAEPTEPTPEPEAEAEPTAAAEAKPEPAAEPEAEPEAQPEPEAQAEPEPEPEAAAEVEPEPEAAAEVEPEPEAEVQPEPKAEAEAEPAQEPEAAAADGEDAPQGPPAPDHETRTGGAGGNTPAEGEAEAEPHPTPEPEVQPEPVAEAATEPEAEVEPAQKPQAEAADGEDAPQGPPAPDHETRTGGAGGNTPAEGEAAEAEPQPEPATQAATEPEAEAQPEPEATAEPTDAANPPQGPATPLTRVKTRAPALLTAYKAATAALKKAERTGTRARLYLVLDRSASMRPYYKDGSAQALAEQTLALAAHLDPEATVPVVFFSTELDGTGELTLTDHENKIDDLHAGLGRMGRTSYHAAVEAVLALHDKTPDPTAPALVIFQTDGAPDAKTPATQSLTEAAKTHPGVFFSFVAFGEHDNKAFDYLRKLKTDNASFFHAGPTPRELTDAELYEGVLAAWRP
ncbi:VWA domain-containing protein [Streptomyces sp. NPDC020298]|uniref:VWA domain-containing protein n=1 Tax=unclassified Streptomyces TaxID=2593676 RepID=UPI0033DE236A